MEILALVIVLLAAASISAAVLARREGGAPAAATPRHRLKARDQFIAAAELLYADGAGLETPLASARVAARSRFAPDICTEIAAAAASFGVVDAEIRARFRQPAAAVPRERLGPELCRRLDEARLFARLRYFRALDEALRREGLPEAPKPPDWLSFFAGGRIPLPRAPWEGEEAGATADYKSGTADTEASAAGLHAAPPLPRDAAIARLTAALTRAAAADRRFGAAPLLVVHTGAGHRDYDVQPWPWGEPYLHAFPKETAAGVTADLLLSHGVKGASYGFTAILIDEGSSEASAAERSLARAGYGVERITTAAIAEDADRQAKRLLRRIADQLSPSGHPAGAAAR